ncbi:hypothetical protein [Spirulina sp. 06S082]|uniref:hypothetical protein n=1 Tax=Spirulina sp. 06S082 TaxID=3110248 RepID=UPI002B21AB1C|nr:hypothetical protein [Spirulina sp. 06S082]MEA5468615.1 hypothetical protein [Spirulina sp. 06S082]
MQYLARVQNNSASGIDLQLLAKQILPENTWAVDGVSRSVHLASTQIPATFTPRVGFLVLVELDEKDCFCAIEDVTDWLLASKQKVWLIEEKEKIENWQHELTLKSQESSMKKLELESSREKMEQEFRKKQEELDRREAELDLREKELEN